LPIKETFAPNHSEHCQEGQAFFPELAFFTKTVHIYNYTFALFFKETKRKGEGGQTSRLSLFFFFIGQTGRLASLFSKNCESIVIRELRIC
jgi:hypothetical protein